VNTNRWAAETFPGSEGDSPENKGGRKIYINETAKLRRLPSGKNQQRCRQKREE